MATSDLSQEFVGASTPHVLEPAANIAKTRDPGAAETRAARIFRRLATATTYDPLLLSSDMVALVAAAVLVGRGWSAAGYSIAVLAALSGLGRYRRRICMRVSDEVPRIAAAAALPLLLLVPWLHSVVGLVIVGLVSATLIVAMRAALYASVRAAYRANWLTERVLIVGTGKLGLEVSELLLAHPDLGLRPVGLVGDITPAAEPPVPVLGGLARISDVVRRHSVSKIIVSLPAETDDELLSKLCSEFPHWTDVYAVAPTYELASIVPTSCMDEIWGIPLLPLRRSGLDTFGRVVKRAFDLIVGTALLVAFAPVLLALSAMGFLCGSRPVMFRQERVTRSGQIMKIAKLRTMSSAHPDSQWTAPVDSCSSWGRWLRATHLDELPQLFNVIRGTMSLVGPRPERPFFTSRFGQTVPHYDERHRTWAGLTGWAQVHGLTGDTSIPERTRFDNYYIEHWSVWLDLVILTRTIAEPLIGALRHVGRRSGS